MSSPAYKVVQYGHENVAHGTRVAAAKKFLGDITLPSDIEPVYPKFNLGVRAEANQGQIYQKWVKSMPITLDDAYYQALPWLLSMTVAGGVTPAEQTVDKDDYLWDFTPGLTAADVATKALDSFTVEIGDDDRVYRVGYVLGRSIKFSGALGQNQPLKVAVDAMGDFIDPAHTLTAGLTIPAITPILANNTVLYADAAWADVGDTALSGLLGTWELEIIGGAELKCRGGSLYPNAHRMTYLAWQATLLLENNADSEDFYDWYRAQTAAALRIDVPGPLVAAGAENYDLQFDLWGVPEKSDPHGQVEDGTYMQAITMRGLYDGTGAATLAAKVITNHNTL